MVPGYPPPDTPAVQGRLHALLQHVALPPLHGKTLFVTGGTGFFGYWLMSLFDLLHRQGQDFRVRLLTRDPERYRARAGFFANAPWVELLAGDARTFVDHRPADWLLHAATDTSAAAHADPLAIMDDILLGTRNTLEQARHQGVRRALLVSSGAVYGPQNAPSHEDTPPQTRDGIPPNPYGEAKRTAELWSQHFGNTHGISIAVARCFAFVGTGLPLDGHFAIGNFIRDACQAPHIQVQGDGTPRRSYLYGADLAIWLLQMLAHGRHGRPYNVGSDQALSIEQLARQVAGQLNPHQPVHVARRPVDKLQRSCYVPVIERARGELGLDVWTDLPLAIRLSASHLPRHTRD